VEAHLTVSSTRSDAGTLLKMVDMLDDDDDVQTVWGNYEIPDEVMEEAGLIPERIASWIAAAGLDVVVNRKGTTYRALSDADKALAASADTAPAVLAANPSVIKRPIVEHPGGVLVGFKADEWAAALG
jgi:arsenate reductase (glutaredoxin)